MSNHSNEPKTTVLGGPPRAVFTGAELHVADGPSRGLRLRLGPGSVRVGSLEGCDVRLADPSVSRLHCELRCGARGVRIVDLDSSNGTFVNGVRVRDAELVAGSTIHVGASVLRLEPADDPVYVELSRADRFGEVLGASAEMRRVFALLARVAPSDATVLIQGETGTGKEAVARAVHEASKRRGRPFITVDCGAVAENLIESEFFGHVRGSFSGAVGDRTGLFEEANGGTVFLDEIGELPLSLQPKLLRVLEAREVRRVGSNVARKVDVRVIAATHRPLAKSVNEGAFREDLYYRLAVFEVVLPPLRARREDIPQLVASFYRQFTGLDEPPPPGLIDKLLGRAWPGNVRELRNVIERSVSLGWASRDVHAPAASAPAPAGLLTLVPADLPLKDARARWNEQFETLYVTAVLAKTGGNVTRASELAGVNRRSLQRMMAERGVRSGSPEPGAAGDDEAAGDDDD